MIKQLKSKLLASVKSKRINVFLVFLLFACLILVFSKLAKERTKTMAFSVSPVNTPQEFVVLSDTAHKLQVTLKGTGFSLMPYYFKSLSAKLDFANMERQTDSSYVWFATDGQYELKEQLGNAVEIQHIAPAELDFRFSINVIRKLPVKLEQDVVFSQGYDLLSKFQLQPDSVTVIGPKKTVDKLYYIETDSVVLAEVKSNIDETVGLKLPQDKSLVFSEKYVQLSAQVEKFTEGMLKIPVNLKNVPNDIAVNYFPKFINVTYYTDLQSFNTIDKRDFKVECDFEEAQNTNQNHLTAKLTKFPEGLKNTRLGQNRVEYIIVKDVQ